MQGFRVIPSDCRQPISAFVVVCLQELGGVTRVGVRVKGVLQGGELMTVVQKADLIAANIDIFHPRAKLHFHKIYS